MGAQLPDRVHRLHTSSDCRDVRSTVLNPPLHPDSLSPTALSSPTHSSSPCSPFLSPLPALPLVRHRPASATSRNTFFLPTSTLDQPSSTPLAPSSTPASSSSPSAPSSERASSRAAKSRCGWSLLLLASSLSCATSGASGKHRHSSTSSANASRRPRPPFLDFHLPSSPSLEASSSSRGR
jgi:hypothetical protein